MTTMFDKAPAILHIGRSAGVTAGGTPKLGILRQNLDIM